MKNKEKMRKILGGLLIGGLLLGGSGLALATTSDAGTGSQTGTTPPVHGPKMPGMQKINSELTQTVLASLVSAGSLTQAQADQIVAKEKQIEADRQAQMEAMKDMTQEEREAYREQNKPEKIDLYAQLVNDGTITQEQVDIIQAATRAKMDEQRQTQIKTTLSSLVEKDVITTEQSTAILDKIAQEEADRQAQMEAMKDMTQEEREAYREQNKPEKTDPMAELVDDGTLTQAQADEVSKVLPFSHGDKGHPGHGNGPKDKGTCTQAIE